MTKPTANLIPELEMPKITKHPKNKHITFRTDEDTYLKVLKLCVRRQRTVSYVLQDLIRRAVK